MKCITSLPPNMDGSETSVAMFWNNLPDLSDDSHNSILLCNSYQYFFKNKKQIYIRFHSDFFVVLCHNSQDQSETSMQPLCKLHRNLYAGTSMQVFRPPHQKLTFFLNRCLRVLSLNFDFHFECVCREFIGIDTQVYGVILNRFWILLPF